ncbi:DUF3159 domain-containing protein [Glycomyces niveus]|uniref:DUF3159 domain-containing protein n=1 Tax=Glycomyces niveus TaxID=2820287 RepID=A0ABS3UAS0_9ACTN|nr:DUF3159 domain-containing protein [Glycomyces sp. NEAU-S30]MBO3734792.1 DUF3159 domain-containing protein [Glycomyces sp. NEAU-S30]
MSDTVRQDTLVSLLGGKRGAFDATAPVVVFILTWLLTGNSIAWAAATSLLSAGAIAIVRLRQRRKPRAVVLGLLSVAVACLIVLYTGRAQDILLPRIVTNAASALVWAGFIVFRRPLLGLIVGGLLGQKTRWRRDPHLLRAYSAASWVWVAMYALRVAILTPFWNSDEARLAVVAGGLAQIALSWPLLVLCLIISGWVIRAILPNDHPGIRHPVAPSETPEPEPTAP